MTDARPDAGLALLLERSWGQEAMHQLVLRELLAETDLAARLGLWHDAHPPRVAYEPLRGLFDLALQDEALRVLIELKVGAEMGGTQRQRQRHRAQQLGLPRLYVLLGLSFFAAETEPDARNIGVPELGAAIAACLAPQSGAIKELGDAYLSRLNVDVARWEGNPDPQAMDGLELFRFYSAMADSWPVDVRPKKVTHPGGPDWIINADAWTKLAAPGWDAAEFYWELVNGRTRFKVHWAGDPVIRLRVRDLFRQALEAAAAELGEPVGQTRRRAGAYMTALEFAGDARDEVLVDGRVSPLQSRHLYDRATRLFERSLELLPADPGSSA